MSCSIVVAFALKNVKAADEVYESANETYSELAEEFVQKYEAVGETEKKAELNVTEDLFPIKVDFAELQSKCAQGEVTGWLYSGDDLINYPITYTDNNSYYLNHLFDGTYNPSGTLFMDCKGADDWLDFNTIVYGHHMADGSMFGSLNKYMNKTYVEEHPVLWLATPDVNYELHFVGSYVVDSTQNETFRTYFPDSTEKLSFIDWSQQHFATKSEIEMDESSRYVTLITCAYSNNNARRVVLFKIVDFMEVGETR